MPGQRYDLEERLINFAVQICLMTDRLPSTAVAKHVSTQLTRSATSPFANYAEAQAAESRQDFVHKLKICLKELRETQAWLKFVERMNLCPEQITGESQNVECPMTNFEIRYSTLDIRHFVVERWRRPTLPRPRDRSTIGADRLNDRVRDGNGCGPVALVASKLETSDLRHQTSALMSDV